MAKKKSSKSKGETRTSFMFLALHQDVVNAVSDAITPVWFQEKDSDAGSNNKHPTNVMGKFKCNNNACSKNGWSSKKIAMLIRGYPGHGYNAIVFNQRCKSCSQLGTITLDERSYIDRIAYRLRKWAGFRVEWQQHERKTSPPHRSDLCEGCKRGICEQKNGWDY